MKENFKHGLMKGHCQWRYLFIFVGRLYSTGSFAWDNLDYAILEPDDLKERLEAELKKITDDKTMLPEINNSNDFAKPYIEIDRYGYNYACRERGDEIFRKILFDIDELLYEAFDNLTFEMATKWAARNRKENEDFRLQLFAKQVDLMTRINKDFGERINDRLQRILKFGPLTN